MRAELIPWAREYWGVSRSLIDVDQLDYENVVALYHEDLYRFAFSLARNSDAATELTQEAYCRLISKNVVLRDPTKVKAWLSTTIYRIFLTEKRHEGRFPHLALSSVEHELPAPHASAVEQLDAAFVREALLEIEEHHRTPLTLFYLQNLSYREISDLLDVPVGTVMSRLSRAKTALRNRVTAGRSGREDDNVVPIEVIEQRKVL